MMNIVESFDNDRYVYAHKLFLDYMYKKSGGINFTNFNHPFLRDDEIKYKWRVYADASDTIAFNNWGNWRHTCGRILEAVRSACKPAISRNLLEHRYGPIGNSYSPLYKVQTKDEISNLENELYSFLLGGAITPNDIGIRFDSFATYLKKNRLGCKWPFLAYLSFVRSPENYFPILPGPFQALLHFYGIDIQLTGRVEWFGYRILLLLADELKHRLAVYGQANSIEIQSYMWVISYLIKDIDMSKVSAPVESDFYDELDARAARAKERERIGLNGEKFIYYSEKNKLCKLGREDLAARVKLVSVDSRILSYDILSFDETGQELHIEVKTTTQSSDIDIGFWLSDVEKHQAELDECWKLYRVWDINSEPVFQDLGNIVHESSGEWEFKASNWFVQRKDKISNKNITYGKKLAL